MRWLAFLLVLLTACDTPAPPIRTERHAVAAEKPQSLGAVEDVLGVAVRGGFGGVMIIGLDLDGPASAAGALIGDFIVAVNGNAVTNEAELVTMTDTAQRTGTLTLELWRQGERRQVSITLTARAQQDPPRPHAPKLLGLQVRALPQAALKSLGVDYGLMVTKVRPPADRSRIMPGDIILAVNQTRIHSLEEFDRLIADNSHSGIVSLLVRRADVDLYIALGTGGSAPRRPEETFKTRRPATDTPLRT